MEKYEAVINAVLDGKLEVRAKDKNEAQHKINESLHRPSGYGYKLFRVNGGHYELRKTFQGYSEEDLQGTFDIIEMGREHFKLSRL